MGQYLSKPASSLFIFLMADFSKVNSIEGFLDDTNTTQTHKSVHLPDIYRTSFSTHVLHGEIGLYEIIFGNHKEQKINQD